MTEQVGEKYRMSQKIITLMVKKISILISLVVILFVGWRLLSVTGQAKRVEFHTQLDSAANTIILISMDTTRADHLGCYGYQYNTTPNIDMLARESLFIEHAFSTVPLTLPAHCSMFTGLIPPTHGVHDNFNMRLPENAETLAEILKQNGYKTYGIVSSVVLEREFGLDQGFDTYDDIFDKKTEGATIEERTGEETTQHALKWLSENKDQKKMMFIHFYDPHDPYSPPAPFDTNYKNPYDGEIAFTDHCIGQIIKQLKLLDLYDDALIVIAGDHGEMLNEHEEVFHSFFVYQSAIRVPLMFKLGNNSYVKKLSTPCSIIDIAPTILSIADIAPSKDMQGINLLHEAALEKENPVKRAIYAESLTPTKYNGNSLLSVIRNQWHYIQTTRPELYDRIIDPLEKTNLISSNRQLAKVLQDELSLILETSVQAGHNTAMPMDPEKIRALESLGYVGGFVAKDLTFNNTKTDPKDLISIHEKLFSIVGLLKNKEYQKAIDICSNIIKEHPDISEAHKQLASTYRELGDHSKEIESLKTLLKLRPGDYMTIKKLAVAFENVGDLSKAVKYTKSALAITPDEPDLENYLAGLYTRQNKHALAIPLFLKKLSLAPNDIEAISDLGHAYIETKQYSHGIQQYLKLHELLPDNSDICQALSILYMNGHAYSEAIIYCKKHLALKPNNIITLNNMAQCYYQLEDHTSAIAILEKVIALNPNNIAAQKQLAQINERLQASKDKTAP